MAYFPAFAGDFNGDFVVVFVGEIAPGRPLRGLLAGVPGLLVVAWPGLAARLALRLEVLLAGVLARPVAVFLEGVEGLDGNSSSRTGSAGGMYPAGCSQLD